MEISIPSSLRSRVRPPLVLSRAASAQFRPVSRSTSRSETGEIQSAMSWTTKIWEVLADQLDLSGLFYEDPKAALREAKFFSLDTDRYTSFWDWLIGFRNPFNRETGHFWNEPTFFGNELEFYILAALTFTHASRHGSRYVWLWLAILWHGFTVELVSYWFEAVDSFWHAQATFMMFGRREPLQIILVYPAYLYMAAIVVERTRVSELTQACLMGLLVVILDFPYDIMGIKLLWWTWHDTDSNLRDRSYWVPITSYFFHATFASSFSLIYNFARRRFVGLSGVYGKSDLEQMPFSRRMVAGNFWGEFKACACAGLFSMPVGILQFIPLFHFPHDVFAIPTEVCMITLGAIYLLVAFHGVNRARPMNLLEDGEREEHKGNKKFGSGKWYYDEIVMGVLVHYVHYTLLVVFANPQTYQVFGLHQTMGSSPGGSADDPFDCTQTRNVTYPYPFTSRGFPKFLALDVFPPVTVWKRPYLCPGGEMLDEGIFDFTCPKAASQVLEAGEKFFWICGKDWTNNGETTHVEYILVIWTCCILGAHVMIQPLIYPRTLFEQFFVYKEFPSYWKYDEPSFGARDSTGRAREMLVDDRVDPNDGKAKVLLADTRDVRVKRWISRQEFQDEAHGQEYAERGGLYGAIHDAYGKSRWERLRLFDARKAALERLSLFDRARSGSVKRVVVAGISYDKGYPRAANKDSHED